MIMGASSRELKSLKAHYGLVKSKVTSFERDSSWMRHYFNQMSSFLEDVNMYSSLATLDDQVTDLKGLLEEWEKVSLEVELMTKASS